MTVGHHFALTVESILGQKDVNGFSFSYIQVPGYRQKRGSSGKEAAINCMNTGDPCYNFTSLKCFAASSGGVGLM